MMAILNIWPNCSYDFINFDSYLILSNMLPITTMLPINKPRTKANLRIGPHNKEILDIIICGMLGDFWADKVISKSGYSTRFQIEQGIKNSAYIHHLTLIFYKLGYCARPVPLLVKKTHKKKIQDIVVIENNFNYRLTLFTFTSFNWIYDSFYIQSFYNVPLRIMTEEILPKQGAAQQDYNKKIIPLFISEYLTPLGLAHWIMMDGNYQKGQGVKLATNNFSYKECELLANILFNKYKLKTSVVKTGKPNQWCISIWKRSMPNLISLVEPYFIPEMKYKINLC